MTRFADTGSTGIVKPSAADKGGGGMARAAIQAGRKVGGIGLCVLAGRRHAVTRVAACIDGHGTMIERCRDEATGGMTDAAILIRQNMAEFFTRGEYPVMAGLAVIRDTDMIKGPRYKTRGQMTHTAITVGGHMVGGFAFGDVTVVTCRAVIHDAPVIKPGAGKGRGVMADRAILRGGQMIRRLDGRRCRRPVMARCAVIHDPRMTENRGCKAAGYVTDTAILRGRNVTGILLGHRPRRIITVTFCAVIDPTGVIKDTVFEIGADTVAHPAIGARGGMIRRLA